MPAHLLYVPTNRDCTHQIGQLAAEARVIGEATGSCTLAVIEHGDLPWSAQHRSALAERTAGTGIPALQLTAAGAQSFLTDVIGRARVPAPEASRLQALLNPQEVAYGAGPNKAALLAAACGSRFLHRRDSDVVVDDWPAGPAYPGVPEVLALGRTLGELGIGGPGGGAAIRFVGTSSFGNAPHDRRDLLAVGERFVIDLELLATPEESPEKLLEETRQYLVVDPGVRYCEDFFEVDTTGRTVMLACAMADVFLELPEMPIMRTLGSDYLRRNALRYLGCPIVFHSRKVRHRYDAKRAGQQDLAGVIDYARRDLRHMVLWPVLARHHEGLRAEPGAFLDPQGALDLAAYTRNLLAALEAALPTMADLPPSFAAVYRSAAAATADPQLARRLHAVADGVDCGGDYVAEVVQGIRDFVFLIGHWRALVDAASACQEALQELYV